MALWSLTESGPLSSGPLAPSLPWLSFRFCQLRFSSSVGQPHCVHHSILASPGLDVLPLGCGLVVAYETWTFLLTGWVGSTQRRFAVSQNHEPVPICTFYKFSEELPSGCEWLVIFNVGKYCNCVLTLTQSGNVPEALHGALCLTVGAVCSGPPPSC